MSSIRTTGPATGTTPRAAGLWPVLLCWVAVALDGFDLVVIGAVIPTLLETGDLGFTPAAATTASTIGLVGVGIGAVTIGPLTDRFGRAAQPDLLRLALLRPHPGHPAGAGRHPVHDAAFPGGPRPRRLPADRACLHERARVHGRGGSAVTRMMTGYHVGAVLTALLALVLVGTYGWESMFVVGGLAGLVTVPLLWAKLPESEAYLRAVGKTEHGSPAKVHSADVVKGRYLRVSIGLWVASFMGLLLVYGLNTWLPTIMGEAGYSIKAGTGLLLVLNLGAVIGLLVAGSISDARGNKPTVLLWFGLAAFFLAMLSIKMDSSFLVYAAVTLAGIFVFSAQVLVYAFVGHLYPPEIRGTALGMAAGVGRVGAIVGPTIGGALLTAGIAYPWGFYVFAVAALLAVLALSTVPAHMQPED